MKLLGKLGLSFILIGSLSSMDVFPGVKDVHACPCASLKNSPQTCRTIRIEPCPSGQVGGQVLYRDYSCIGSSFTDTGFYIHQTTCKTPQEQIPPEVPTCSIKSETKTESCPTGYAGIQTYVRTNTCVKGVEAWKPWQQTASSCLQVATNPISPLFIPALYPRGESVTVPPEIVQKTPSTNSPAIPQPSLNQTPLPSQVDISQAPMEGINLDGYRRDQNFLSELIAADAAWLDPDGPAGISWQRLRRSDLFREDEGNN